MGWFVIRTTNRAYCCSNLDTEHADPKTLEFDAHRLSGTNRTRILVGFDHSVGWCCGRTLPDFKIRRPVCLSWGERCFGGFWGRSRLISCRRDVISIFGESKCWWMLKQPEVDRMRTRSQWARTQIPGGGSDAIRWSESLVKCDLVTFHSLRE